MNTDGTNNDGRQDPRTAAAAGNFSPEPVFGDPQWVEEHLDWIRKHYRREDGREGAAA